MGLKICPNGEPLPESEAACLDFHKRRMKMRAKEAESLQIPLMISEFGACYNSQVCINEILQVVELSEKNLAHWAYWQFK